MLWSSPWGGLRLRGPTRQLPRCRRRPCPRRPSQPAPEAPADIDRATGATGAGRAWGNRRHRRFGSRLDLRRPPTPKKTDFYIARGRGHIPAKTASFPPPPVCQQMPSSSAGGGLDGYLSEADRRAVERRVKEFQDRIAGELQADVSVDRGA